MISNIMGLVPEDEEPERPTIFGDLRKKLVDEFASEIHGVSDNFERLKVFLRVRPFTPEEINAQKRSCLTIEDDHYVTAIAPKESNSFKNSTHCSSKSIQKFKFSKIFKENSDQLDFYNGTVKSLVEDFLVGQNCLVFAYGVTNAGKTYTVQGNPQNPGVLPRTLETIFNHVNGKQWRGLDLKPKMFLDVIKLSPRSEHEEKNKKDLLLRLASFDDSDSSSLLIDSGRESCPLEVTERSQESDLNDEELLHSTYLSETAYGDQIKYSVWVSFAEVYNEQVFDLFEVPNLKKRSLLKLGEDKHGNPYIRGLTEVNVTSAEEALKLLTIGQKNLRKAATKLNHNSSRSHCIFNIKLLRVVNRENPSVAKVTMLSLCDLAGSERACKTNSTGDRLKEAGNINTSLMTLGRCIETMRSNQLRKDIPPRMIPYRDSKLTRLFQGFFSGRGKAVMIVNVNKCSTLFDETFQVFKFSAIAKQVVIQQKAEKPVTITISPVLPVKALSHMERASIPWADDVKEISHANYSNRLSIANETMEDEDITEREKGLLDIIDNCKKAIANLKESLAKEKKERMLDEIKFRDEITKELMEQFVAIEKNYSEKIQDSQLKAEDATDSKITKMLETLNPAKKRSHDEVEPEEEMVPLHVLQESQKKIAQCELQIQQLTQRLESTKKQMRRMTTDNSKLVCENTCLQFQVSDMLQVPVPQTVGQGEVVSDNLEQANVLSKLTTMLKSTQEKLKEKQNEVCDLEEQLQEAGETFHHNHEEIEELKKMVEQLKETNKKPAECEVCKARSENTWQLKPELKNQAGTANGVRSLRSHRDSLYRGQAANTAVTQKEKDGGTKQRSPWFSCMGIGAGKKRKSNVPDLLRGTRNAVSQYRLRDMVVEKADESRVLRVMLNNTRGLVPTPTKTSLLRSKKFPSSKDLNSENASSSPVTSLHAGGTRFGKGGKKKDASPGVKRRMLAPICTNLIGDKKLKGRRRSSLVCSKRSSVSFSKRYNLRSKN